MNRGQRRAKFEFKGPGWRKAIRGRQGRREGGKDRERGKGGVGWRGGGDAANGVGEKRRTDATGH